MTPTDADRQRARKVVDPYAFGNDWLKDTIANRIAAAIAAARAEALEQAVEHVIYWLGEERAEEIVYALRNLKEPGHGK